MTITQHTIKHHADYQTAGLSEYRKLVGTYGFNREHLAFYAGISPGQLSRIYTGRVELKPYQWAGLLAIVHQYHDQIVMRDIGA